MPSIRMVSMGAAAAKGRAKDREGVAARLDDSPSAEVRKHHASPLRHPGWPSGQSGVQRSPQGTASRMALVPGQPLRGFRGDAERAAEVLRRGEARARRAVSQASALAQVTGGTEANS